MARQKDPTDLELAIVLKSARTAIRLKHSVAADREINERLPQIEDEFYAAINAGKKYVLEAIEL